MKHKLLKLSHKIAPFFLKRKPILFVDITVLNQVDYGTGIQRVVRSVVQELYSMKMKNFDINLVCIEESKNSIKYKRACNYEHKLKTIKCSNKTISPKKGDIFLGLDLVSNISMIYKEGIFFNWKKKGVKINFVVYDILPILYPNWWPNGGASSHTQWIDTVLNCADQVISISKTVSDDVKTYYINNKNKIDNDKIQFNHFHLGADINNSMPSMGLPSDSKITIEKLSSIPTFIMVGTIEPRKGHAQTLKAFENLWKKEININLAIVGKEGWLMEDFMKTLLQHPQLNKKLFWFNAISDEYLEKIYDSSVCLIAASQAEGFGLPLIEAAKYKIPILARDIPVFKEVAGENAYYFPNENTQEILSNTIQKWLELYKLNNHPKPDNMRWLTWRKSTQSLTDILKCD